MRSFFFCVCFCASFSALADEPVPPPDPLKAILGLTGIPVAEPEPELQLARQTTITRLLGHALKMTAVPVTDEIKALRKRVVDELRAAGALPTVRAAVLADGGPMGATTLNRLKNVGADLAETPDEPKEVRRWGSDDLTLALLTMLQLPVEPNPAAQQARDVTIARAFLMASELEPQGKLNVRGTQRLVEGLRGLGLLDKLRGALTSYAGRKQEKAEQKQKDVDAFFARFSGVSFAPLSPKELACFEGYSQARGNLKALYVAEESYRAEFDTYLVDVKTLGFAAKKPAELPHHYTYAVVSASANEFRARAVGVGAIAGDTWEITQNNDLTHAKAVCPDEEKKK